MLYYMLYILPTMLLVVIINFLHDYKLEDFSIEILFTLSELSFCFFQFSFIISANCICNNILLMMHFMPHFVQS